MAKLRGNRTLTGATAELWFNGELVAEMSKVEFKVSANREDVQLDFDLDSKMTGLKGEFTVTLKKVYSRWVDIFEAYKNGEDVRGEFMTKLADKDAVGKQQERYSIGNCWFNELPIVSYDKGAIVEEEVSGGFTPSDMVNLDKIS